MNQVTTTLPKTASLESQKLAMDFACEVATHRLLKVEALLTRVNTDLSPVDALFAIREALANG